MADCRQSLRWIPSGKIAVMTPFCRPLAASLLLGLAACAPALNWRETRPEGADVAMLFPCRPDRNERAIGVAGAPLRMQMHSCDAQGTVFSLAFVDVADVASVAPVLAAMRAAAVANVDGASNVLPWRVPGATPNEQAARLRIEGSLPDGRRVVENTGFFVRGLRLYQATALGGSLDAEALDTFFGSIRIVP
jgi:hypothetical protein